MNKNMFHVHVLNMIGTEHAQHCYVPVDMSPGVDCVHPCTNPLLLNNTWFSPTDQKNKHWFLVDANGGMNFTEAADHCHRYGSYVGLPSSIDDLEKLTSKILTPTWLGLIKKPGKREGSYDLVWERFGALFTDFGEGNLFNDPFFLENEFINSDLDQDCFQVKKDNNDTIILEVVDCSAKVERFMCEYFITENEKKSQGKFSNNELLFHSNGFNYAYYHEQKNWTDAVSYCESKGPGWSLAEISLKSDLDEMVELIKKDVHFWVGAKKEYLSESEGCGIPSNNPFKWQTGDINFLSADIEHKPIINNNKEKNKCCLAISPALRPANFFKIIQNKKNYKKNKEELASLITNMYESAQCDHTKDFLCHKISTDDPFCLACGDSHQVVELDGERICEKNEYICECENGDAVENEECFSDGENMCKGSSHNLFDLYCF